MTSSSDGLGGPKAEADRLQHAVREIGDDGNAGGETENWAPAASNPTFSPVPSATSLEVSPASASTLASEELAKKEGVEGLAVGQTTGRAAEQAPGKAADHAVEQAEEAKNQGEEPTAELTADRAANQAAEQATESKAEVAAEHTAEQSTERSAEQTAEPEFSHICLLNPSTTGLKIAPVSSPTSICKELARKEGAVDQTSEQASEQAANQATEQPSNRIAESTTNLTAEAASVPTPAPTTVVAFKASEPAPSAPVPAVPQTSATHFALNTPAPGNSLASIVPTGLAGSNTPALVRLSTPLPVTVDHSHETPVPPPAHASYSSEANASLPDAPSRPNSQPRPVAHDKTEEMSRAQPQQLQLETQTASPPSAAATLSDPLAKTTSLSQPTMAEILLAMGHMSAAAALPPPPTVTPYEVTLSGPLNDGLSGPGPTKTLHQIDDDADLECFARLEFADSVFQMTTYAVIIGRDQRALVQARLDEQHAEEVKRRTEENASMGVPLPSPMKRGRSKFSKSYVSEEGGMLGPESDSDDAGRPAKRRKPSTNASSHKGSDEPQENIISNRQYISHTPGAAAVELRALRTNPYYIPFIGIHSPGPNIASRTKAISRKHLKIEYNAEKSVFEAIPMHGNGFFCKDIHYKEGTVVLKSGDHLQIRDVDFRFVIPGVEKGCTGAPEPVQGKDVSHARSQAGMDISFDFVQRYRHEKTSHSSDELSELDASPPELSDFGEDTVGKETRAEAESDKPQPKPDDVVQALQETGEGVEVTSHGTATRPELAPDLAFVMPPIPKKRGPGRPPKNGIMSKREQRLLKKQQQELAKKMKPQPLVTEPPVKRKVGRPRKHPLPDNAQERTEKRKYKPRKPKDENETGGSDAERRAREKKEKKVRAKSPPPDLRIEDFTDEQLQKPNKNYSLLIDEALTPPGPPGLTLKQIYNRISVRNPWFYFFAETKGWESSVRHNLIGNEAFKKDEKSGRWYRVLGVELDAGKKRKAPSPEHILSVQVHGPNSFPLGTAQLVPAPGGFGYPPGQMVPAAYNPSGFASQPGPPAQQVQQHGGSVPLTGQGNRPGPIRPPALTHAPGYGPLPAPALAPLAGPQTGTYSSPYASQPPPPAEPSVQTEGNTIPSTTASAPTVPPPPAPPPPPGPNGLSADLQNQQPPAATTARTTVGPAQIREAPAAALRAAPSLPTPLKPVIEPGLLTFILGVKRSLISSVEKTNNPKSQAIIMSALNLYIGLKKEAIEDDKTAHTLIKGVASVIQAYYSRQNVAAPAPTSTFAETPLPPIICDVNVLGLLVSFKNASIRTLKERFGDSQAEMITLSAIDRVLGLATMSIMPRPAPGEPVVANCESYEQNLMGSLCTLLSNMQYEPADAK